MKTTIKLLLIPLFFLLLLSTTCEKDNKCKDTDLDNNIEVFCYAYGTVSYTKVEGTDTIDVTSSYKYKDFYVEWSKSHCNGEFSKDYLYYYKLMNDGTLQSQSPLKVSFSMDNSEDFIRMVVRTHYGMANSEPPISVGYSYFKYDKWATSTDAQAEITMSFMVYDISGIDYDNASISIKWIP